MITLYHKNRSLFKLKGSDTYSFLQGIITNDSQTLPEKKILYTVMLTSTGRFNFDFFLYQDPADTTAVYLDVSKVFAADLLKRLSLFKLRSDVEITDVSDQAYVMTYHGESTQDVFGELSFQDPRCAALGYRELAFGQVPATCKEDDMFYIALCLANCIPRAGFELIPKKTIPLEANLEELGALSFSKGCYLGQELTARTKHQGLVRKKLYAVTVEGDINEEMIQTGILVYAGEVKIGALLSYGEGCGIAKLRIESVKAHKNLTWSGILKETKKDCCKINYSPHK